MPDTSNSLLDFILDLLSDHEAAGAFYATRTARSRMPAWPACAAPMSTRCSL